MSPINISDSADLQACEVYLCACLLSSCRRVKAGLLSGLGPRRFGVWPSAYTSEFTRKTPKDKAACLVMLLTFGLFLGVGETFQERKAG